MSELGLPSSASPTGSLPYCPPQKGSTPGVLVSSWHSEKRLKYALGATEPRIAAESPRVNVRNELCLLSHGQNSAGKTKNHFPFSNI